MIIKINGKSLLASNIHMKIETMVKQEKEFLKITPTLVLELNINEQLPKEGLIEILEMPLKYEMMSSWMSCSTDYRVTLILSC